MRKFFYRVPKTGNRRAVLLTARTGPPTIVNSDITIYFIDVVDTSVRRRPQSSKHFLHRYCMSRSHTHKKPLESRGRVSRQPTLEPATLFYLVDPVVMEIVHIYLHTLPHPH